MGVDAIFKAKPTIRYDEERFEAVKRAIHEWYPDPDADKYGQCPSAEWDAYDPDAPVIEVRCLWRYYGPGYERGPWDLLREFGDFLAVLLGETAELRYGGDTNDDFAALMPWPEARLSIQAHFDEHGHEPYRRGR